MRDIIDRLNQILEHQTLEEEPDEVRDAIRQRIDKIPDEQDLVDVLRFTKKYTLKKDVEKFTTLRNYKDLVSSVFLRALADADLPDAQIKKFLKKLSTDGILDEKRLLTPGQVHSTNDIIDNAYESVFNAIKMPVFTDISGKIGEMGDVGKGEYLLDILSPQVNRRGAPGDLDVDGTKVELKAGKNGRIGPAGSQSLAGRFQREYVPVLQKLQPGKPIPEPTVFNPKQNMTEFSEFFDNDPKKVKTALAYMLEMHYPEGVDVKGIANRVVGSNGQINGQELKKEMLKASFTVYQAAKGFDGIIIMDEGINKFLYVGSPEDMEAAANNLVVAFPSWTDTQGNAMKVTLSKGTRGGGASAAGASAGAPARPAPGEIDQGIEKIQTQRSGIKASGQPARAPGDTKTLGRKRR